MAAAVAVLATAGPISSAAAQGFPVSGLPTGFGWLAGLGLTSGALGSVNALASPTAGCSTSSTTLAGPTAGTLATTCDSLLTFVGPAVGQVSNVVGPTIIGSTVLAPVQVTSGSIVNTAP